MKKLLLLIIGFVSLQYSNAQFTKGQKLIGPSLNFNTNNLTRTSVPITTTTQSEEKIKTFSIGFGFDALKFVSSKKATGWKINYSYQDGKTTSFYTANNLKFTFNQHTIGLGYFIRNFIPIKPKFNFYYDIVCSANYGIGKTREESYINTLQTQTSTIKSYGISAYLVPGFTYQFKKNLLVDAALNSIGSINYFNTKQQFISFSNPLSYENNSSGFSASSSLSSGALLSNFSFSIKWIIEPKK